MGKWVDILRSGEAEQAKGVLCSSDPNVEQAGCCLGIRLMIEDREFTFNEDAGTWEDAEFSQFDMPDPEDVRRWDLYRDMTREEHTVAMNVLVEHGVYEKEEVPDYMYSDITGFLAELNDEVTTFPVIAEIIERNGWDNSDA